MEITVVRVKLCQGRSARACVHSVGMLCGYMPNSSCVQFWHSLILLLALKKNMSGHLFIPRVAMRKRGLCCRPMCVRPSVTLVWCIHTAEDIVKLLSRPGIPIILVFFTPSAGTQILQRGRKIYGGRNFASFDRNRCLSGKQYEIGHGCHGTLIGSHKWRINHCRFRWPWVTSSQVSRSLYTYLQDEYLINDAF